MTGTIQKAAAGRPTTKQGNMKSMIAQMEGQIARALPSVLTPERFTRMVFTALSTTPRLYDCTPASFMGAVMNAAQLGLEPNTPLGQAYLIPYGNQCQFQIGYKGLIDLAYRSGKISSVSAHVVYSNDEFEIEMGLNEKLRHVPALGDRGEPVRVYAVFRTKDGGSGFGVMSIAEAMEHGKRYSKTYGKGPWQTEPLEMCKKTILKKVLKYAPLHSEFARGAVTDGQTLTYNPELEETVIEAESVEVDTDTGEVVENV